MATLRHTAAGEPFVIDLVPPHVFARGSIPVLFSTPALECTRDDGLPCQIDVGAVTDRGGTPHAGRVTVTTPRSAAPAKLRFRWALCDDLSCTYDASTITLHSGL